MVDEDEAHLAGCVSERVRPLKVCMDRCVTGVCKAASQFYARQSLSEHFGGELVRWLPRHIYHRFFGPVTMCVVVFHSVIG